MEKDFYEISFFIFFLPYILLVYRRPFHTRFLKHRKDCKLRKLKFYKEVYKIRLHLPFLFLFPSTINKISSI